LVKVALSNQEQKYSANYMGTTTGANLMLKRPYSKANTGLLNIDSIHVVRSIVQSDKTEIVVSEIVLIPEIDRTTNLFRFRLARLYMKGSKAKVRKKCSKGQLLDLSIDIKLDAIWQTALSTEPTDTSRTIRSNNKLSGDSSFTYKSATLGSSSIIITKVSPIGPNIIRDNFYSGWFQPLGSDAFKLGKTDEWIGAGNYTLTVTIKEANPYGLRPAKLSEFLNATSSDINSLIKQILPSANK
jgi:hypothetical protein